SPVKSRRSSRCRSHSVCADEAWCEAVRNTLIEIDANRRVEHTVRASRDQPIIEPVRQPDARSELVELPTALKRPGCLIRILNHARASRDRVDLVDVEVRPVAVFLCPRTRRLPPETDVHREPTVHPQVVLYEQRFVVPTTVEISRHTH